MYKNFSITSVRAAATVLLALVACTAMAAEVNWIDVKRDGGKVDIHSELVINAPLSEVYAALLDYNQFAQIGDTFADSRYVEPAADGAPRVYTRIEGCIWFFCKTIERFARIEVEPQRKIVAIAEPENSDAALSIESWTLTADGDSTIIEYRHELDTGFWVPPLVGALVINRSVKKGTHKAAVTIEDHALANAAITQAAIAIPTPTMAQN